jgi:hypothetical protein
MKPKQLANVLIKILGLSLIAHGIPALLMAPSAGLNLFPIVIFRYFPTWAGIRIT